MPEVNATQTMKKNIPIDQEIHRLLVGYCERRGAKLGKTVEFFIAEKCAKRRKKAATK